MDFIYMYVFQMYLYADKTMGKVYVQVHLHMHFMTKQLSHAIIYSTEFKYTWVVREYLHLCIPFLPPLDFDLLKKNLFLHVKYKMC